MRIELGQNLDLSSLFWNKYYRLFLLYKNAMKTERDIISELCFEIIGRIINQWINQCISLYWYKRFIWRLWKWKCREGKRPAQGGTANWGPDQDYGPYFLSLASVFPWHHLSLSSSSNVLIVTFFFFLRHWILFLNYFDFQSQFLRHPKGIFNFSCFLSLWRMELPHSLL